MGIKKMIRLLLVGLSLLVWGCVSAPVATVESGQPAASDKKVLVATQKSQFKQAVVSEIYDRLKQKDIYLKIIDVNGLKRQPTAEYSAIIIINRCMAGRPDPRVESFIDREPRKDKLIVLTTGIRDSWTPDTPGVDAMTSASVLDKSDQVARLIAERVLTKVTSKDPTP